MARQPVSSFRSRIRLRRVLMIVASACITSILTSVIDDLPKFDLVESAMNDDNFTDIVLKTRGELPIDTNIRVLTYDRAIFDSSDRVDREALALRLASLLELKPRVVGVDFLLEDERPGKPDGDAMLAALISDHRNLIFGIFHEDSLRRFRMPPASFGLREEQLGCINLQEDKDRTIRTYMPIWGTVGGARYPSFDVRVAQAADSGAVDHLRSFGEHTFVIDYAAGIGETRRDPADPGGDQIFPVMPIDTLFSIVSSGDSAGTAALREQFAGKVVLVGYGDIRNGQVTTVVDRFYTPLKPEKNTLPDMHGVTIHANIINTILNHRIVRIIPLGINLIWGAMIVMAWLFHRQRNLGIARPARRLMVTYGGFAVLFVLGVLLPVLAYRYTPYKFSIYTPVAGLLLAVPTLEVLDKGIGILRDLARRRRLERGIPESMRAGLRAMLTGWDIEERLERGIHLLQMQFHAACALLFQESIEREGLRFDTATIAAPTLGRMLGALDAEGLATASPESRRAAEILQIMNADPVLARTLRFSRSLYIALNEIRRQSHEIDAETREEMSGEGDDAMTDYADLALKTLSDQPGQNSDQKFDELYGALERLARRMAELLGPGGELLDEAMARRLHPFALRTRCRLHGVEETFIYFGEQEDANNRDDYYDLVYGGPTIRCQPEEHPGLGRFRDYLRQEHGSQTD